MSLASDLIGDIFKKPDVVDNAVSSTLGTRAVIAMSELFLKYCKDFEADLTGKTFEEKLEKFTDYQKKMTDLTKEQSKIFK